MNTAPAGTAARAGRAKRALSKRAAELCRGSSHMLPRRPAIGTAATVLQVVRQVALPAKLRLCGRLRPCRWLVASTAAAAPVLQAGPGHQRRCHKYDAKQRRLDAGYCTGGRPQG